MAVFKKAGIVGTGLIGGSIGLALRQKKLADEIVGTSRHDSSLIRARRMGAIDRGSRDLRILSGCDIVILAAPVQTILAQAGRIQELIPQNCIVMDVASTKAAVVKKAGASLKRFVGCHPLAGSEKQGIAHARPDL
ncbi:MAG TPA: prephenate dehydrogenase/arogenate dehydrogenase family protein, partial [Candidatus Omnitrophota bacterium]|nr:prephenate dehydrogenase/arogenate dehydrogenase family protein [Candidatus Omnitrophota bacterium]